MQITPEMLTAYIGGQMEIQNRNEGYLYRGEVAEATVDGKDLRVKFAWVAKGTGDSPLPSGGWVKDDTMDYAASLEIYAASNIGPGESGGDRLCLSSWVTGEMVVLYPADGSKLDPSKVEGLLLASA